MDESVTTGAAPTPAATETPVPTSVDPAAVLTPSRGSSYDEARRNLLKEWQSKPMADEPDAGSEEPVAEDEPVGAVAETPAVESVELDEVTAEAVSEAPTLQEAVEQPAEPKVDPTPKPYAVKNGETDYPIPEGTVFTYKADGAERTRTLDEVIRFAQLGENYDRRSRELANNQRKQEEQYRNTVSGLQQQYTAAWNELVNTARRLAEDEEFREEYLEEYQRLASNPQEMEMRMRAQRAEQLERELQERKKAEHAAWEKQVWQTVDSIINAELESYDPELRPDLVKRARDRFHREYSVRGKSVLSDTFVRDLVAEERSIIDRAVQNARQKIEKELVPVARAAAVVETTNKIADQALQRNKEAAATPRSGPTPTPVRPQQQFKNMSDARKALKNWERS